MLKRAKTTIAGLSAAAMLAVSSVAVVPAAQAASPAGVYNEAPLILASHRDRDRRDRWRHRDHRHRGSNFPAGIFGFTTGAILGSMLAQPHPSYGYSNWDAYCASKYRSYKPWTGTYTGYDGREHRCR